MRDSGPPLNQKEAVLAKLDAIPDFPAAAAGAAASNKTVGQAIGALALKELYEDWGMEGVKAFADWATHPTSGILVQKTKPLPDKVIEAFHCTSLAINEEIQAQAPLSMPTTVTRRHAITIAASGVLGAGMGAVASASYSKLHPEDRYAVSRIAATTIMSGTIFAALVASVPESPVVTAPAVTQPKIRTYPVSAHSLRYDAETVAECATKALENLLAPARRTARG